ncbi:MAG: prolipoprotein diacylglyceryl transferase family protein [candidate division WOR-3 bacterium]
MCPWIEIGPVKVASFGVLHALGVLFGFLVFVLDYRKKGSLRVLIWLVPAVLIGAFVGSRMANILLFYRTELWPAFLNDPLKIFFGDTGESSFGSFFGALFLVMLGSLITGVRFLILADSLTVGGLVLGVLGRIGCFLNGCCFGRPTSLPWAVRFPLSVYRVHPTQLYEAGLVLVFLFAVFVCRGRFKKDGLLFFLTTIFWGAERFFLEFLRVTPRSFIPALSWDQWIAAAVALAGIAGILWIWNKEKGETWHSA